MSAYTDAVARGLAGMKGVSSGTCPGCEACMELDGCEDKEEHRMKCSAVDCASGESHFSRSPCGVCGSTLGGDRHVWHWVNERPSGNPNVPFRDVEHEDDMCTDCVLYLANGDEPEQWRASA